jgi:hypothetical protein
MPDTDLPYYQTGSSITFARKHTPGTMQFAQPYNELLFEDAWNLLDDNKRVVEEIKDCYIMDDDKLHLYVKFLGEQQTIWIDYKLLYPKYPQALSSYFRRSDLPFLYPNGVVGTETLIPEEEDEDDFINTTNNAGGKQTNMTNTGNEQLTITNEEGEHPMEINETNDTTKPARHNMSKWMMNTKMTLLQHRETSKTVLLQKRPTTTRQNNMMTIPRHHLF